MSFFSPSHPDSWPHFRNQLRSATVYFLPVISASLNLQESPVFPPRLDHQYAPVGVCGDLRALRNHSPPKAVLSRRRQGFRVGCRYQVPQPLASTCDCLAFGRRSRTTTFNARSERMGQTKPIDLPEPVTHGVSAAVPSRSRWWLR